MAKLRLKKGKRYGLCGPNGAGKSTLMRAIANGQVGSWGLMSRHWEGTFYSMATSFPNCWGGAAGRG